MKNTLELMKDIFSKNIFPKFSGVEGGNDNVGEEVDTEQPKLEQLKAETQEQKDIANDIIQKGQDIIANSTGDDKKEAMDLQSKQISELKEKASELSSIDVEKKAVVNETKISKDKLSSEVNLSNNPELDQKRQELIDKNSYVRDKVLTIAATSGISIDKLLSSEDKTLSIDEKGLLKSLGQETINKFVEEYNKEKFTQESVTKLRDVLTGKEKGKEYLEDTNKSSLFNVIGNNNINDLHGKLIASIPKDGVVSFLNSSVPNMIRDLGYKSDGFMGHKEIGGVIVAINDAYQTQKDIVSKSSSDKLSILLDFNKDGKISNVNNYFANEANLFKVLKDEKKAENFLANLGMLGKDVNINDTISQNYVKARQNLELGLNAFAGMPETSLAQLLLPKEEFQKSMNEILVHENILNNPQLSKEERESLAKIKQKEPSLFNSITKGISLGISTGAIRGAGISSEGLNNYLAQKTRNIINTLSFGASANGMVGLYLGHSGNIGERANYSVGLANGVPVATAGVHLNQPKDQIVKAYQETLSLFPKEVGTKLGAQLTGMISPGGAGAMLGINRLDEKTSAGIEAHLEGLKGNLEKAFKSIVEGKSSTDLGLTGKDKEVYDIMSSQIQAIGKDNLSSSGYVSGLLENYKAELYKSSGGWKLNGASIGIIGPFIGAGLSFEKLYVTSKFKGDTVGERYVKEYNLSRTGKFEKVVRPASETKDTFASFDEKTIESVRGINNSISEKFNPSKENIKNLSDLDKAIHKLLNGKGNLDNTWDKFLKDLPKVGLGDEVSKLKDLNFPQKLMVLQNMAINMMRKEGLQIKEGGVSLDKNMREYDKNRTKFFDDIFSKEFSGEFVNAIKTAREAYYVQYGEQTNYKVGQLGVKDGVSFSGVESGYKTNIGGLNPYAAGHIASFESGGNGRVRLQLDGVQNELVDKTPNHIMEHYVKQMESVGYNFKEGDKNSEMKNLIKAGTIDLGNGETILINSSADFAKDPECLNDKLLLNVDIVKTVKEQKETYEVPNTDYIGTFKPEYDKKSFSIMHFYEKKKDDPKTPEESSSEPETSSNETPSKPETSKPETSIPETSIPEVSIPEVSIPEVSIPEVSIPEVSIENVKTITGDVKVSDYKQNLEQGKVVSVDKATVVKTEGIGINDNIPNGTDFVKNTIEVEIGAKKQW